MSASALDTSFNGTGLAQLDLGPGYVNFTAITVLPGGKILAAGNGHQKSSVDDDDFLVARFNSSGKLDATFGNGNGFVWTPFNGLYGHVTQDDVSAILQLPGGKFALAGKSRTGLYDADFSLARYNANGSLDTSFGKGGLVTTDFGSHASPGSVTTNDLARAIALNADGKIVAVGWSQRPGTSAFDVAIARYNTNGSLDTSFSGDGRLTSDAGTVYGPDSSSESDDHFATQIADAVAILPGGKILIGGTIQDSQGATSSSNPGDEYLSQFTPSGLLDKTFGGGKGYVRLDINYSYESLNSIAVLANGKIVAGGFRHATYSSAGDDDFIISRFDASGSNDLSFGSRGSTIVSFTQYGVSSDEPGNVLVQPNGKILAVGYSIPNYRPPAPATSQQLAVVRLNSNGTFDNSFSGDGRQLINIDQVVVGAALDYGGRAVFCGSVGLIGRLGADAAATAQISGTFYNDKNANGKQDAGEPVLSGWQAYVDSNSDGVFTPGERIATADSKGVYHITGLPPGTYRIREVRLNGWTRTQPAGDYPLGYWDVTVAVGQAVFGKGFGNKKA